MRSSRCSIPASMASGPIESLVLERVARPRHLVPPSGARGRMAPAGVHLPRADQLTRPVGRPRLRPSRHPPREHQPRGPAAVAPLGTSDDMLIASQSALHRTNTVTRACAPLLAPHDPQAGPHVVDGADLVVDESEREEHLAHRVFGDVGRHLARLLRPRDPQAAVDVEHVEQLRHSPLEIGALGVEGHDRRRPCHVARLRTVTPSGKPFELVDESLRARRAARRHGRL